MDLRLSGIFKKASPWQEFFLFAILSFMFLARNFWRPPARSAPKVLLKDPGRIDRTKAEFQTVICETELSWEVKDFRETSFSLALSRPTIFPFC